MSTEQTYTAADEIIEVPSYLVAADIEAAATPRATGCTSACQIDSMTIVPCSGGTTQVCVGDQSCDVCQYTSQRCIMLCEVCQGQVCFVVEGCVGQVCSCDLVATQEEEGGEDTTATVSVLSVTSNSATLYIRVDPNFNYYRIFCRLLDDESDTTADISGIAATSNFQYEITGLQDDTYYILNLGVNNTGAAHCSWAYGGEDMPNPTFKTNKEGEFSWTFAGLDSVGTPVLGDSKVSGHGIYVAATEWNELVDFINDGLGTSLSEVAGGGVTKISADIVNSAANSVGAPQTYSGAPISAKFFNDLADYANDAVSAAKEE